MLELRFVHQHEGVVFGALVGAGGVGGTGRLAGAGLAYGVVLWVVLAAIVMPIWLGAVGFPMAPLLPNFNPMSLVGHAVYGVVLGVVYTPPFDNASRIADFTRFRTADSVEQPR